MSKCFKCSKLSKEALICCSCGCSMHGKCVGLNDDLINSLNVVKNLKLFCDECLNYADGFKSFKKIDALSNDIKKVIHFNEAIIENLNDLKTHVVEPIGAVDKTFTSTLIEESVDKLKNEMKRSWASVVGNEIKKNLEGVSEEVKLIQKTITVSNESKARESNVVLFNLNEQNQPNYDKETVINILKKITDNVIKNDDILKIYRQGKKDSQTNKTRPLIIQFNNTSTKMLVLKNLFKIKSLTDDLNKVKISHDLTPEQKNDYKKLISEAKEMEKNGDGSFLCRVRGYVGKWRIIRTLRKTTEKQI